MKVLDIINNHFSKLNSNEKHSLLIDLAKNITIEKTLNIQQKQIKLFAKILKDKKLNINKQQRLSKILLSLLINAQKSTDNMKSSMLDALLKIKPEINFNYYSPKHNTLLAIALFEVINKTTLKEEKKLSYYKKLMKWISSKEDVNRMYFLDNRYVSYKMEFLSYFVDRVKSYKNLVYHLIMHTQNYKINLVSNGNYFLRMLFWNFDNEKDIVKFRKKVIKNLSDSVYFQEFYFSLVDDKQQTLLSCLMLFSELSTLSYILETKTDLIKKEKDTLLCILYNHKLSMEDKKTLLLKYKDLMSEIKLWDILESITKLAQNSEENILDYINFLKQHFIVTNKLEKDESFNSYCYTNYVSCNNLVIIEKIVSQLPPSLQAHKANKSGRFPLHNLISYEKAINKTMLPQVIEIIKNFKQKEVNFNTQTQKGNTPLHIALKLNQSALLIKELILSGSSLFIRNKYGKTPYDYAKKYKYYNSLQDFIEASYEKEKLNQLVSNDAIMNEKKHKL